MYPDKELAPMEVWGKFTVLQKNFRIQHQEIMLSVEQSSARAKDQFCKRVVKREMCEITAYK